MDSVVAISRALKLDRPVYMGCSVGGYLAPDLALYRPDDFRAVIGVNSAIAGSRSEEAGQPYVSPFSHPRCNTAYIGSSMYGITSPEARETYRRETGWVYSQGGPGIFGGDLHYFSVDHNLIGKAHRIDTSEDRRALPQRGVRLHGQRARRVACRADHGFNVRRCRGRVALLHERRLSPVSEDPDTGARRDPRQATPARDGSLASSTRPDRTGSSKMT